MFAWKNTNWDATTAKTQGDISQPMLDARTTGMVADTKVATDAGWTAVKNIREGQQVLTFDGGMQTVTKVFRHSLQSDTVDIATWPFTVPAGALGNREDMVILPHQSITIESDAAEDLTDDPFASILDASLWGFLGISQDRPSEMFDVIQLHFGEDEIVFAKIGALFLCRAQANFLSDISSSAYEVLPMETAEDLVDCLMYEAGAKRL